MADIISLLKDYWSSNGQHPATFFIPWQYDDGLAGFNIITSGSNPIFATDRFSTIAGGGRPSGLLQTWADFTADSSSNDMPLVAVLECSNLAHSTDRMCLLARKIGLCPILFKVLATSCAQIFVSYFTSWRSPGGWMVRSPVPARLR